MATINWQELESTYGNRTLQEGSYTTKVSKVVLKDATSTGSFPLDFDLEPVKEGKFKPITEWITFKQGKDGWRQHRMKSIMVSLGVSDEWAKAAVEKVEDGADNQKIAELYEDTFKKVITKNKSIEVECWSETYTKKDGTQGTGSRTGWCDPAIRMGKKDTTKSNNDLVGFDVSWTSSDIDPEDVPF